VKGRVVKITEKLWRFKGALSIILTIRAERASKMTGFEEPLTESLV
jgi:hypothetical protein